MIELLENARKAVAGVYGSLGMMAGPRLRDGRRVPRKLKKRDKKFIPPASGMHLDRLAAIMGLERKTARAGRWKERDEDLRKRCKAVLRQPGELVAYDVVRQEFIGTKSGIRTPMSAYADADELPGIPKSADWVVVPGKIIYESGRPATSYVRPKALPDGDNED